MSEGQWIERATLENWADRDTEQMTRIRELEAENKALREGRGVVLETLPPECAPKGRPVLVAGGIAMKKTGGQWYSGMAAPAFERPITWEVKWWAPIPQQNDLSALSPAPVSVGEAARVILADDDALPDLAIQTMRNNNPAEGVHPGYIPALTDALRALAKREN